MNLTPDQCISKYGHVSPSTYRRIAKVYRSGVRELIAAMDAAGGHVSVSAAATIATQPHGHQRAILDLPLKEYRTEIRRLRAEVEAG